MPPQLHLYVSFCEQFHVKIRLKSCVAKGARVQSRRANMRLQLGNTSNNSFFMLHAAAARSGAC